MQKTIDLAAFSGILDELAATTPDKVVTCSLRQFVYASYDKLKALFEKGWSRTQVTEHLRNQGLKFSDTTFFNYLAEARRYHAKLQAQDEKNARKAARTESNKSATINDNMGQSMKQTPVEPSGKHSSDYLAASGQNTASASGEYDPLDAPTDL